MLVRIGVLALAGVLGLLGSMFVARTSPAASGLSDTTATTTSSTVGTTGTTSTTTSASTLPTQPPVGEPVTRGFTRTCVTVGGVVLLLPGRPPIVLKPVADPSHPRSATGAFVYPDSGAVVSTRGIAVRAGNCGGARANVVSPSLFGGAVTASAVTLSLRAGQARAAVQQLRIAGRPVVLAPTGRIPVAGWGYATKGLRQSVGARNELQAALAVHLYSAHAGLPRGTTVVVGFAVTARTARSEPRHSQAAPNEQRSVARRRERGKRRRVLSHRHRRARLLARLQRAHRPLTLKPSLGLPGYVFPVAGSASFADTYGAARSDVSWHHGDDIFAPLGTPVVAVADGTLNRVGWERLGGWRLWVRDRLGNEFYYAHLSGYTRAAIRQRAVKAGEVLGFVGNTGDAIGTPFHLHFEIHPRSLLPLRYDGAVDPTTYLERWQRLGHERASRPLHPRLPRGIARVEAVYVYRELLAAQGLIRQQPRRPRIPAHSRSGGDFGSRPAVHLPPLRERPRAGRQATAATHGSTLTPEGIGALFLAALAALAATVFRRRG